MKRTLTHAGWKGFERAPAGRLLAQVVEIDGAMGIAHERSVGFEKDFHVHDRDMLVCPRGASSMRIRTRGAEAETFDIDAEDVLFVPKTCEHDDASLSAVYDTFALYPSDTLLARCMRQLGVGRREAGALLSKPFLVRRSRWFSEALDRYFVERLLETGGRSPGGAFLERELVREVLRSAAGQGQKRPVPTMPVASGDSRDDAFTRALQYVESNLFEKMELRGLAKRVGASVSTLLRSFRREVGVTPYAYVKARRLDEARHLLRRGSVQVKEVALLVGYADVPSFSHAYKTHFGVSPRNHTQPPRGSATRGRGSDPARNERTRPSTAPARPRRPQR